MGHGVSVSEVPTGVKPPVRTTAGLPVYFGTAMVNAGDVTAVNVPVVCYTLAEYVETFGPVNTDFDSWSLNEPAKAHFSDYAVGPAVFVNVLDPTDADMTATGTAESHQLVAGTVKIQTYGGADAALLGVIKSTVVVKDITAVTTYVLDTDYTLTFDDDGYLDVTRIVGGAIGATDILKISFDYLDPTGVTSTHIIGGYSGGQYTGLGVLEQVYPTLRLVPGFVVAPGWSSTPAVAAAMITAATLINGAFRAMALLDLSTDTAEIADYSEAAAWKVANGYDSVNAIAAWPKWKNGDDVYHLSTIIACVANRTDSERGGTPYASPSNKEITGDAAVNDDDDEIYLTQPQANALNDQGIVTVLNGFNGWKLWGNRTGGYPGTTDPKDAFIPLRRMFNWINNTIILTVERDVDEPGNRRLIDGVVGTIGSFFNGLVAQGALIAGKIEFRSDENPTTDLADGIYRFHNTLTPPSPAQDIQFITEYDPTALAALFA